MSELGDLSPSLRHLQAPLLLTCFVFTSAVYAGKWTKIDVMLSGASSYFRADPFSGSVMLSFLGSYLLCFVVVYALLYLAYRLAGIPMATLQWAAALTVLVRAATLVPTIHGSRYRMAAAAVGMFIVAVLLRRLTFKFAHVVLVVFTFLALTEIAFGAWGYMRFLSADDFRSGGTEPRQTARKQPRIVVSIFDEMDYELATRLRPSSVEMPEFDRLRTESFFATDAHSPATSTVISIPSLLIGKRFTEAEPTGPKDLSLRIDDGKKQSVWREEDTILAEAHNRGLNTAIVGWYHPYCRIFRRTVTSCFSANSADANDSLRHEYGIAHRGSVLMIPGMRELPESEEDTYVIKQHRENYNAILARALQAAADPKLDFIVLHWPVPHLPAIYDRNTNDLNPRPASNYMDNLELVDRTIALLRSRLEAAGLWDETILAITADHPLRKWWQVRPTWWTAEQESLQPKRTNARVPFIVKLPHQRTGTTYSTPFDNVLLHDLLSQWIQNKTLDSGSVSSFLDRNRERFPIRYELQRDLLASAPDH